MKSMLHVGTILDKGSLEAIAAAVISIIEAQADEKTKRAALQAFSYMANVENISISHCNLTNNPKPEVEEE